MKKFFYVVVLATVISTTIGGCSEQQIKPKTGGGTVSDPTGPR